MKHPLSRSIVVLLWMVTSVIIGLTALPLILLRAGAPKSINPYLYIGIIVGLLLVSALAWFKMMQRYRPETVEYFFSIGIGLITGRVLALYVPVVGGQTWLGFFLRIAITVPAAYLFFLMLKKMQSSWVWVRRLMFVSNFWMAFVISITAALIAVDMAPWMAIVILAVASVYDAWAVWKSGTMVSMAKFFLDRRAIPGIAVPYKVGKEERFALLGGGDIFFIVLVAASFYRVDVPTMVVTAVTMSLSVVLLMFLSQKQRFYPALPFIFAGLVIGLGIRFLVM